MKFFTPYDPKRWFDMLSCVKWNGTVYKVYDQAISWSDGEMDENEILITLTLEKSTFPYFFRSAIWIDIDEVQGVRYKKFMKIRKIGWFFKDMWHGIQDDIVTWKYYKQKAKEQKNEHI